MSLLDVRDLHVSFPTTDGLVQAVRGLSFSVDAGHTLAIVGESGSGKTVSTQAILGLTPDADISGRALFEGVDLLQLTQEQLRRLRGAEISVIFQDPLTSLHPLYKIGWQIAELILVHDDSATKKQARERAIELLGLVGIPHPAKRVDDYPHQFSGGMRQRAMIAMALALNPKLIVADEPTTALDATVQAQILDLIGRLQREFDIALILITHDLGVVADVADEVLVMYAGRPVERADRRTIYYRPHHPYTKGLLESLPGSTGARKGRLTPIPGQPPSLIAVPSGCAFHPRCRYAMPVCSAEQPPLAHVTGDLPDHASACWLPHEAVGLGEHAEEIRLEISGREPDAVSDQESRRGRAAG
ncbi:ABC transporter ATP-binding protein [Streptosporangiaceae bacterium NEAU-GS5]|nr:ABC transporter ATP-binding protein [Streptosporangiaceae bacterium NEAU-GS5]